MSPRKKVGHTSWRKLKRTIYFKRGLFTYLRGLFLLLRTSRHVIKATSTTHENFFERMMLHWNGSIEYSGIWILEVMAIKHSSCRVSTMSINFWGMCRGARLLRTTLNADIEVIRTKPAEPAWPTRYTQPRLIRTMISISDKSALTKVSVLSEWGPLYTQWLFTSTMHNTEDHA